MYLGEELGPDGLNILDASGLDEGLELVGLKIVTKELLENSVPRSCRFSPSLSLRSGRVESNVLGRP